MKWPYSSGEMVPIGSPGTMSIYASTPAEACENMRGPRRASAVAARAEDFSAVRRVIFMARPRYQIVPRSMVHDGQGALKARAILAWDEAPGLPPRYPLRAEGPRQDRTQDLFSPIPISRYVAPRFKTENVTPALPRLRWHGIGRGRTRKSNDDVFEDHTRIAVEQLQRVLTR